MPSKWLRDHRQQDLRDHKKRIDNMKSSIDTSTPREMPMSQRNLIERERKRVLVEKDNRLLLDRLAIAMSSKNIDNTLVPKPFVSLMELQRKKQLKKIMIQNSRLLERIQCTVPSYDHVVWEKDAEHHVGILRNMTEFPDLFVAPGCHKKGYDMVLVDAERAQQKALQQGGQAGQSAVLHGGSASPHKGRPSHGKQQQQQQKSPSGPGGEDSPISQKSQNSAFVPYSYFPEEQYTQYQMQLQLQQQQLQLQLQQQQAQLEGDGQLYGTAVPFANALTPEQQYAHQQQMFLYHQQQQQQQRLTYNNPNANVGPANPQPTNTSSTTNPNVPYYVQGPAVANNNPYYAQQMQYNNHNTNTSNTITNPNTNTNISPAMGVQLPNIYQLPPGHMGSSQPY